MQYLNLLISVLQSERYQDASHTERSIWMSLMSHCAFQENGGVIRGCLEWPENKVLRQLGLTRDEIRMPSKLWTWSGSDLRVEYYPKDQERVVKAKRKGGQNRHNSAKTDTQEPPENPPNTSTAPSTPDRTPARTPDSTAPDDPDRTPGRERNGMEGKGRIVCGARERLELIPETLSAYPKPVGDRREAELALANEQEFEPGEILRRVKAFARVVAEIPKGARNRRVCNLDAYFGGRRWTDDLAVWKADAIRAELGDTKPQGISAQNAAERYPLANWPITNGLKPQPVTA